VINFVVEVCLHLVHLRLLLASEIPLLARDLEHRCALQQVDLLVPDIGLAVLYKLLVDNV
jgi:hypothetical protein